MIENYDWQNGYTWESGEREPDGTPRQIAFYDIDGDGIEEMFYCVAEDSGNSGEYYYAADLVIVSCPDGKLKELYRKQWDLAVAGGFRYLLFVTPEKELYAYTSFGDEQWDVTLLNFVAATGGSLDTLEECRVYSDYSDGGEVHKYYAGGAECTEEEWAARRKEILDQLGKELLRGNLDDEEFEKAADAAGSLALNLDEAISILEQITESEDETEGLDDLIDPDESEFEDMLFPDSDVRLITEAEAKELSKDELQMAINEIYARNGYKFKKQELLDFFGEYDWYKPTESDMSVVTARLSDVEKANVDLFNKIQQS